MNPSTRACIAFIVARSKGIISSSVYDYSQSKHISISGTVEENNVNIYDYSRSCYITGSFESLYDYGNSAYLQLNMNGNNFNGYDYHTSSYFNGQINGSAISIYDYETSAHYNYSI